MVALVDAKGHPLLTVMCDGPWVLMKPAKGAYQVYAQLMEDPDKVRSAKFTTPSHGQQRIVLQFPGS